MNKTEFTKFYSEVLAKSPVNREIRQDFVDVLTPFLSNSTLYATKMSRPNLKLIPRIREFGYKKKQKFLCLVEQDGKELVVSKTKLINSLYPKKVKNTEKEHRAEVIKILRHLVKDQMDCYRMLIKKAIKELADNKQLVAAKKLNTCPLSGRSLNSCKVAVDHIVPFIKLVDDWMLLQNLTFEGIKLKGRGNSKYFEDTQLMASWQEYHAVNSSLQLTCSDANLKASSKGYKSVR